MFTLIAFSEAKDTNNVLSYLAGVHDQHVRVEQNNIIVPAGMNNLLGCAAIGDNITGAQIESPALRRTLLLDVPTLIPEVHPVYPLAFFDSFYTPIPLDEYEPIRFLAREDATGASRMTGLIWLGDGAQTPVGGEIYTVRATAGVTLTPYAWTNGELTFTQTLPAGRYAVVGMIAQSASLIAARLVFVGGTWRPGCLGRMEEAVVTPSMFSRGGLGPWGEFTHDQPPTCDFLAAAADTSEVVWLDVIRLS